MKNVMIGFVGSVITSCAFANPFTGIYVTGALGGISTDFQARGNATIGIPGDPAVLGISNNSNFYANSLFGTLGLGYAYPIQNFIIGIQGDVNFFNTDRTQSATFSEINGEFSLNSNIKAQLKNSYDILLRPGWLMGRSTLLYGLIGASFGDFQVSQSASLHESVPGIADENSATGSSNSSWKTGLTIGVGVEQYFGNNIGAALEYSYTNYGNLSFANNSSVVVPGGDATLHGKLNQIEAFTNSISLRVFYSFC